MSKARTEKLNRLLQCIAVIVILRFATSRTGLCKRRAESYIKRNLEQLVKRPVTRTVEDAVEDGVARIPVDSPVTVISIIDFATDLLVATTTPDLLDCVLGRQQPRRRYGAHKHFSHLQSGESESRI